MDKHSLPERTFSLLWWKKIWRIARKIKGHFLGPNQIGEKEKKLHYSYNFILSAEIYFLYLETVYVVKIGILKSQIKVICSD